MSDDRIVQLEKFGMIWSTVDVAWEEGLSAARAWANVHGHLLAPLDATYEGANVGIFLKNARAAARRADDNVRSQAEGLPADTTGWALSEGRREQLEEIDASWCPAWAVTWQRAFHLARLHLEAGEPLPTRPGQTLAQGEDLGRWVQAVRTGWDKLTGVQQWMCAHVLGIEPADETEKPKPSMSQAQKWAMHLAAAQQFFEREGHLKVPRKHVETIRTPGRTEGRGEERPLKLGAWIANQRSRAATLTPERVEQLSAVGMRWAVPPLRGKRGRPRNRPDVVLGDRGYDHDKYRRLVRALGVKPLIARRGTEHGSGLGTQRWVVERAFAHLHWFRRLRVRWEIRDDIHEAFLTLGCALICWRPLSQLTRALSLPQ